MMEDFSGTDKSILEDKIEKFCLNFEMGVVKEMIHNVKLGDIHDPIIKKKLYSDIFPKLNSAIENLR